MRGTAGAMIRALMIQGLLYAALEVALIVMFCEGLESLIPRK